MNPVLPMVEPHAIRSMFGSFPSGVVAVCADLAGERIGMLATSFSVGVSFSPPIVLFSAQNSSGTWARLREAPEIGISVLAADQAAAGLRLASRTADRFEGLETRTTLAGGVLIAGAAMVLTTRIVSETPAGDHRVVMMEVTGGHVSADVEPLVYQSKRFHGLRAIG